MVTVSSLERASLYLDANIVIYIIERLETFSAAHLQLIDRADEGIIRLTTSELTLHECLVKPFMSGNSGLANVYQAFLDSELGIECTRLERPTLIQAARFRARLGLKAADSIHAAAAIVSGCTHFFTSDRRLRVPSSLSIVQWDELTA